MDIHAVTIDAIILKSRDYKEQDKALTYFSLEHGKGIAIARGACKPGGSLRGIAQPFCRARLTITPPKYGVSYIEQAMPDTNFITLDAPLQTIAYASYISELADMVMPLQRPSRSFFILLLTVFSMLKHDDEPARTVRFFELHAIAEMGLLPELSKCGNCSRRLVGGMFHLSPAKGDLLCATCGKDDPSPLLCPGTVQTMRRMLEVPITKLPAIHIGEQIMAEMEAAFAHFFDYHLADIPEARRVLRQLLD